MNVNVEQLECFSRWNVGGGVNGGGGGGEVPPGDAEVLTGF